MKMALLIAISLTSLTLGFVAAFRTAVGGPDFIPDMSSMSDDQITAWSIDVLHQLALGLNYSLLLTCIGSIAGREAGLL